jgi:hypothetical protein
MVKKGEGRKKKRDEARPKSTSKLQIKLIYFFYLLTEIYR